MSDDSKIVCQLCGAETHAIQLHIKNDHPEMTIEEYTTRYPDAPLLSNLAKRKLEEREAAKAAAAPETTKVEMAGTAAAAAAPANVAALTAKGGVMKKAFNEVFNLCLLYTSPSPRD